MLPLCSIDFRSYVFRYTSRTDSAFARPGTHSRNNRSRVARTDRLHRQRNVEFPAYERPPAHRPPPAARSTCPLRARCNPAARLSWSRQLPRSPPHAANTQPRWSRLHHSSRVERAVCFGSSNEQLRSRDARVNVSGEHRLPACSFRQPAEKKSVVGKLPTTTGKLPALPGKVALRYSFTGTLTNGLPRRVKRHG